MSKDNNNLQSKFFNLYWHYFATGLAVYLCARFTYQLFSKQIKNHRKRQHEEDNASGQENKFTEDDSDEEDGSFELQEDFKFVPLEFKKLPICESKERSEDFYKFMNTRRSVRNFSDEDVPIEIIHNIIKTAGMKSC